MEEKTLSRQRLWQIANADKHHAQMALTRAIRTGKILPSATWCEVLNPGVLEENPIVGHHQSYAKDDWLKVEWICRDCHHGIHTRPIRQRRQDTLRAALPMIRVSDATKARIEEIATSSGANISTVIRTILERAIDEGIEIEAK